MKLNLGSGNLLWEGYMNFDLFHSRKGELKTDIIGDMKCFLPFKKNSFEEIISVHAIEHLEILDAVSCIKECYRILKPGGKLIIEGPDILGAYELYVNQRDDVFRFEDFVYGGEGNIRRFGKHYKHLSAWTGHIAERVMTYYGFKNIKIGVGRHHGMGRRDFRAVGVK